jgi:hypothetical protein
MTTINGRITVSEIQIDNIPTVIKNQKQWLTWRDNKKPVQSWQTNPDSLMTCVEALALAKREGYGGIGYRFTQEAGIIGFDLDHCIDTDGKPNAIATAVVNLMSSYTEISVSRTGIHILFASSKEPVGKKGYIVMSRADQSCEPFDAKRPDHDDPTKYLKQAYECYPYGRYFTMTGTLLKPELRDINDRSTQFAKFLEKFQANKEPPAAQSERVVAKATSAVQSDKQTDIDSLRGALATIDPDDYDMWFRIGRGLKSCATEIGDEAARALYVAYSMRSSKYNETELARKWDEPSDGKINIGTIYHEAQQAGWDRMAIDADGRRYKPQNRMPEIYWDMNRQCYIRRADDGQWLSENETQIKALLACKFFISRKAEDNGMSEAEKRLIDVRSRNNINYAGPLAGWKAGYYNEDGQKMIITKSPPTLDISKMGEVKPPLIITGIIQSLLIEKHQWQLFLAWLKTARECLDAQVFNPGQMLVLCGPPDCGKSLLQNIITKVLGGREAAPYQFLSADTTFNKDLMEAEHLKMEDIRSSTDIRSRREFGAQIKMITACDTQRLHAKGQDALILRPFWRATLSLNDEPENMSILPPLDDSITDKLICLKAQRATIPMPTNTPVQKKAFWNVLMSEVPGLIEWLRAWKIPKELLDGRYGVKSYIHPYYTEQLSEMAPETHLLEMIERYMRECGRIEWTATALDIRSALIAEASTGYDAKQLLSWPASCGTYLARLARQRPTIVQRRTKNHNDRSWVIRLDSNDDSQKQTLRSNDTPLTRIQTNPSAAQSAEQADDDNFLR